MAILRPYNGGQQKPRDNKNNKEHMYRSTFWVNQFIWAILLSPYMHTSA